MSLLAQGTGTAACDELTTIVDLLVTSLVAAPADPALPPVD